MPLQPAVCAGPACVQRALHIVARPDSQFIYMCVNAYDCHQNVTEPQVTEYHQKKTCTQSGSPHNVMHFI